MYKIIDIRHMIDVKYNGVLNLRERRENYEYIVISFGSASCRPSYDKSV